MWYTVIGYMVAFVLTMPIMTALGALIGEGLSKMNIFRNSTFARILAGIFGLVVAIAAIVATEVILYLLDWNAGYEIPAIAGAGACLGGYSGMKSSLLDEKNGAKVS